MDERVPNRCQCFDYSSGQFVPMKAKHAASAYDLCPGRLPNVTTGHCQIYNLFWRSLTTGKHPADYVLADHRFEPTTDDRDQLDWVCWMNLRHWLGEGNLRFYAGVPRRPYPERPKDWLAIPQAECAAYAEACREVDRVNRAELDAIAIREDSLPEFIAAYRAAQTERDRRRAETCPVFAEVLAAKESGSLWRISAATAALAEKEHRDLTRSLGWSDELHSYWHGAGAKERAAKKHHTH